MTANNLLPKNGQTIPLICKCIIFTIVFFLFVLVYLSILHWLSNTQSVNHPHLSLCKKCSISEQTNPAFVSNVWSKLRALLCVAVTLDYVGGTASIEQRCSFFLPGPRPDEQTGRLDGVKRVVWTSMSVQHG